MNNSRRIIVIVLSLLTAVIASISIYLGIKLGEQPDVTPDDSAAGIVIACSEGFTDAFNDATIGAEWQTFHSDPTYSTITESNSNLTIEVNAQTQASNFAGLITQNLISGEFQAEIVVPGPLTLTPPGSESGQAEIALIREDGTVLFKIARETYFVDDVTIKERVVASTINGQSAVEDLPDDTGSITLILERKPSLLTMSYTIDGEKTPLLYDVDGNEEDGQVRITVKSVPPSNPSVTGIMDDFYLGCIRSSLPPGTCQCDLGVVMDQNCGANLVPICTSQVSCECRLAPTNTPVVSITNTPVISPTTTIVPSITTVPSTFPTSTIAPSATVIPTAQPSFTPIPSATPVIVPTATQIVVQPTTSGQVGPIGPTLPPTALISDKVDRLLLATGMIVTGAILYRYALIKRARKKKVR